MKGLPENAGRVAAVVLLAATVWLARQQALQMHQSSAQLRTRSNEVRAQVIQANTIHANFDVLAADLIALSKTNEVARSIVSSFGIGFR